MSTPQYTERSLLLPRSDSDDEAAKPNETTVPNGGAVAWTQVLTGHLVVFNVWGYITS